MALIGISAFLGARRLFEVVAPGAVQQDFETGPYRHTGDLRNGQAGRHGLPGGRCSQLLAGACCRRRR